MPPTDQHRLEMIFFIKQHRNTALYQISYPSAITPIQRFLVLAPALNHRCLCGFPKRTDPAKDSIALLKCSGGGAAAREHAAAWGKWEEPVTSEFITPLVVMVLWNRVLDGALRSFTHTPRFCCWGRNVNWTLRCVWQVYRFCCCCCLKQVEFGFLRGELIKSEDNLCMCY